MKGIEIMTIHLQHQHSHTAMLRQVEETIEAEIVDLAKVMRTTFHFDKLKRYVALADRDSTMERRSSWLTADASIVLRQRRRMIERFANSTITGESHFLKRIKREPIIT